MSDNTIKLNLYEEFKDTKYSDIISIIVSKHHSYLKKELPITEALIYKILRVHYSDSSKTLTKVHKLYSQLKNELELKFIITESVLFPIIGDYQRKPSKELLKEINNEIKDVDKIHGIVEKLLKELRSITNDYKIPPTGCSTFEKTYENLIEIEEVLTQNIGLERDVMYEGLRKERI